LRAQQSKPARAKRANENRGISGEFGRIFAARPPARSWIASLRSQ
jgi:hypothetical protein